MAASRVSREKRELFWNSAPCRNPVQTPGLLNIPKTGATLITLEFQCWCLFILKWCKCVRIWNGPVCSVLCVSVIYPVSPTAHSTLISPAGGRSLLPWHHYSPIPPTGRAAERGLGVNELLVFTAHWLHWPKWPQSSWAGKGKDTAQMALYIISNDLNSNPMRSTFMLTCKWEKRLVA